MSNVSIRVPISVYEPGGVLATVDGVGFFSIPGTIAFEWATVGAVSIPAEASTAVAGVSATFSTINNINGNVGGGGSGQNGGNSGQIDNAETSRQTSGESTLVDKGASGDGGYIHTPKQLQSSLWTETKKLSPVQNAYNHFIKHGSDFGAKNALDYVRQAQSFLRNPPAGTLTKVRPNGDILRYHPATNTFGVLGPNGAPRTFFKPAAGINYWNLQ